MQEFNGSAIDVLVVDDHLVVAEGVSSLLAGSRGRVVGYAGEPATAANLAATLRPDIILLDLRLGPGLGSDAVKPLQSAAPGARILMFTAFPTHPGIATAMAAGAHGFLIKDVNRVDLVEAIEAAARGERVAVSGERGAVTARARQRGGSTLSPRELQILERVAVGHTNGEIAAELHLASTTVKTYWQSALSKLRARNRAEAVTNAYAMGVLS